MHTQFQDLNAYVYYSMQGILLDGLIWCLGPFVCDSREYSSFRIRLALLTRSLVRRWCRITD